MQAQEPIRGFDRQANNSKELDYWEQVINKNLFSIPIPIHLSV